MAQRKQLTPSQRLLIYEKTKGKCAYCGANIDYKEMQVDHVIPLKQGGEDNRSNMLPACRSCNHYKGSSILEVFRKRLEKQPNVLMRDNVTYQIAMRFGQVQPTPHKIVFYFERMTRNEHI